MGRFKVYVLLIASMFFWGMSFIWYKQAYLEFKPITLILFRLTISSVLLVSYSAFFKLIKWPRLKDLKYFFLLAFFEPFMYSLGESFGMTYVSSTLASILIATIPIFAASAAFYFYKEQFTFWKYAGIGISFFGVILVVYFDGKIGEAPFKGIVLMSLAVFSAVGYSLVLKKLLVSYGAFLIVIIQNIIGVIFFLPIFLITDAHTVMTTKYTLQGILPIIYLAVFASTLAFLFFIEGVRKIGVTGAIAFTNFIPIVTAVFAAIILNEKMSMIKITGILFTICGLMLTELKKFPKIKMIKSKWKS